MSGRLAHLVFLVVVWIALWGDVSVANVLSGVVVAGGLLLAFPGAGPGPGGMLRPIKALRFLLYFAYKLLEANAVVAWEIITPGNENVNEGIVEVPITGASDAVITTVANSVSLTPGTLTIEVRRNPATLYVHVLHLRSIESTRRQVLELERLALDAIGSREVIESARVAREAILTGTTGDSP